jgi:hypothetical protein
MRSCKSICVFVGGEWSEPVPYDDDDGNSPDVLVFILQTQRRAKPTSLRIRFAHPKTEHHPKHAFAGQVI